MDLHWFANVRSIDRLAYHVLSGSMGGRYQICFQAITFAITKLLLHILTNQISRFLLVLFGAVFLYKDHVFFCDYIATVVEFVIHIFRGIVYNYLACIACRFNIFVPFFFS